MALVKVQRVLGGNDATWVVASPPADSRIVNQDVELAAPPSLEQLGVECFKELANPLDSPHVALDGKGFSIGRPQ